MSKEPALVRMLNQPGWALPIRRKKRAEAATTRNLRNSASGLRHREKRLHRFRAALADQSRRMNPTAVTLPMYNRVSLFIGTEGVSAQAPSHGKGHSPSRAQYPAAGPGTIRVWVCNVSYSILGRYHTPRHTGGVRPRRWTSRKGPTRHLRVSGLAQEQASRRP